MRIEKLRLDAIQPSPYNPRRISDENLARLETLIREHELVEPLVVNCRTWRIVGGHQRYKVLQKMGVQETECVIVDLPEAREKALNLALNNPAAQGEYDFSKMADLLQEIDSGEFDVSAFTAFDEADLERIAAWAPENENEETTPVPAPLDDAINHHGDLWVLGKHRLLCGDSAKPEDVDLLLDGAHIHLVNTDPPYNVKVEPRSNNAIAAGLSSFAAPEAHHQKFDLARHPEKAQATSAKMRPKDRPLENDFVSDADFDRLLTAWFGNIARVLDPGRAFYIWGGYSNVKNYPRAIADAGLYLSQVLVWVKEHPLLTRKDFMGNHESAFYGWREGAAHYFNPEIHNATDVWSVKKVASQSMVHLTEKPVELAVRAMTYSSKPGENVLDLFGGSGSTLIGAERTGRRAYLMEMDPTYCDVIVKRWQNFTGKRAKNLTREGVEIA